jgi:peptide/nickel transport system substrate-binding protein
MRISTRWGALLAVVSLFTACTQSAGVAPAGPAGTRQGDASASQRSSRTLTIAMRVEPNSISSRPLATVGIKNKVGSRLFTAALDINDDRGNARPYLAEELPQLDTDSWRVFPDGTMETRYRLKPNLTWHDGAPVTANDFVLAWRVYTTPEITAATTPPTGLMDDASAPDDRTLILHWRRLYPGAGALQSTQGTPTDFPPLPVHILKAAYEEGNWEAFGANPYWSRSFIGTGPYKLDRWEPGSFLEGSAFDQHVLGRPKIERVRVSFIGDPNAVLANVLAGTVDMAADDGVTFQQGIAAKREWATTNGGTMIVTTDIWRAAYTQFRPEVVSPRALHDVRVRRALASAIDKQAVSDAVYEGEGIVTDTPLAPTVDFHATIDAAVTKYPYDVSRTEQLMNEAGYRRGADGVFTSPSEGRFVLDIRNNQSPLYERERSIMASMLRQTGFDIQESVYSTVEAQDGQIRSGFPGLYMWSTGQGEAAIRSLASAQTPRADNRYTGANRGGWMSDDYDRILQTLDSTLERSQHIQTLAQAVHVLSEELPAISLYYDVSAIIHVSAVHGPGPVAPDTSGLVAWDVQNWELR